MFGKIYFIYVFFPSLTNLKTIRHMNTIETYVENLELC